MKVIKIQDLNESVNEAVEKGKIIIYPTDTVYGIGCNVENANSVETLYKAKGRETPFSVLVPSLEWIYENCIVSNANKGFLKQLLPGPYTVVLKYKSVPKILENKEKTIGVRIVSNRFCDLVRSLGILFITTSVNISGEETISKIQDIPEQLKSITEIAIDAGELGRHGSRVFDLTSDDIKVLRP